MKRQLLSCLNWKINNPQWISAQQIQESPKWNLNVVNLKINRVNSKLKSTNCNRLLERIWLNWETKYRDYKSKTILFDSTMIYSSKTILNCKETSNQSNWEQKRNCQKMRYGKMCTITWYTFCHWTGIRPLLKSSLSNVWKHPWCRAILIYKIWMRKIRCYRSYWLSIRKASPNHRTKTDNLSWHCLMIYWKKRIDTITRFYKC